MDTKNTELNEAWENLKTLIFKAWDAGFEEGLEESFMQADMKDFLTIQNGGERMDATVEMLWAEWKSKH
jgi:hypothetical protein